MLNRNINKIEKIEKIEGSNNFVFQYIDAQGSAFEERKSLEDFLLLHPLILAKQKLIDSLESQLDLLKENKDFLDDKVLAQSNEIHKLKAERDEVKQELEGFIKQIEGKDLSQSSEMYQSAFNSFMDGKLDTALSILDEAKMLEEEQKEIDRIKQLAENRMLKAQIFRIQNKHDEAEMNYEKAVNLFPDWYNCLEVGRYFQFINKFHKAERYYDYCLLKCENDHEKADTLNSFAVLQNRKNEFDKAEVSYIESLKIYRRITKSNSQTYLPNIGMILNNLASLQKNKNKFDEAEASYIEALEIRRNLADINPKTHLPYVATTLNNLGNLQRVKNEFDEAEASYMEALEIRRHLTKTNHQKYLPYVATTLGNLAILQSVKGELHKAEMSFIEALEISKHLVKINQQTYLPRMADILGSLGNLHNIKNEFDKAEVSYLKALKIRRSLAKINSQIYLPKIAEVLNNLAALQNNKNEFDKAEIFFIDALEIYRRLSKIHPQAYQTKVGMTLNNLAIFYLLSKVDNNKSYQYIDESFDYLLPFSQLGYVQNYLKSGLQVLQRLDVDTDQYLKKKLRS